MRVRRAGDGRFACFALVACLACTTTPLSSPPAPPPDAALAPAPPADALSALQHEPLDPADVRIQPEGITVGESFLLDFYTLFHSRQYQAFRLEYDSVAGGDAVAHLLLPAGAGRHPLVFVFPILAGSHTVSEALAKTLVNRGYAALRIERRELELKTSNDPALLANTLRNAVLDARRLLDWAQEHPRLDPQRVATAGVSLGSMQALLLAAVDPRVRGGFFALTGGGLAEILYDSGEKDVRTFRDRLIRERALDTRDAFVSDLRVHTLGVDPLSFADRIDPSSVLLATGRWDRVIPIERAEQLWRVLRKPSWIRLPTGHYQFFPYFWWVAGRGADHLDALFARMIPITDRQAGLHDVPAPRTLGPEH